MNSIRYDLSRAERQALVLDCAAAAETAVVALARYDERLLRAEPVLAEGVRQRGHAFEAQALIGLVGGLCPLEDLVLHDSGMDVRSPSHEITRAAGFWAERRRLAQRAPAEILDPGALRRRLGLADPREPVPAPAETSIRAPWERVGREDEDEDGEENLDVSELGADDDPGNPGFAEIDALLARTRQKLDAWNDLSSEAGRRTLTLRDPAYDSAGRCERWLTVLEEGRGLPAVLAAALALDAWLVLEPSERMGEFGFALAATLLRQRGLAVAHLPTVGLGLRRGRFRWSPHLPRGARVAGLLVALSEAAAFGQADCDRLALARTLMLRKCEGRRGNSKLAELVDLFVASPLVTVQLAAARLQVTPQAVEAMLRELGTSLPRELTGRKRYRAWGIV